MVEVAGLSPDTLPVEHVAGLMPASSAQAKRAVFSGRGAGFSSPVQLRVCLRGP